LFDEGGRRAKPQDAFNKKLSRFQKVLLIKNVAPEQFIAAVTEFVKAELGQKFVEPPVADLNEIYKDLNNKTPLIFVLSQGSGTF